MNNLFITLYGKLHWLICRQDGQNMAEYALVAALISLSAVSILPQVGTSIANLYSTLSSTLVVAA